LEFSGVFIFDGSADYLLTLATEEAPPRRHRTQTIVKSLQLVASDFRAMHTIKHGVKAGIILAPEVVRN
jgi:hypothetical protein